MGEFQCLKLSLFKHTLYGRLLIEDGAKPFASLEGQNLHGAEINLYTVSNVLYIMRYFKFIKHS